MRTQETTPITAILDPAHLEMLSYFDPEPLHQEPQQVMLKLHERYHELQRVINSCAGKDEDAIVAAIKDLITSATKVAVFFARHKDS